MIDRMTLATVLLQGMMASEAHPDGEGLMKPPLKKDGKMVKSFIAINVEYAYEWADELLYQDGQAKGSTT